MINIFLALLALTIAVFIFCIWRLLQRSARIDEKLTQMQGSGEFLQQHLQAQQKWQTEQQQTQQKTHFDSLKAQQDALNQGFALLQSQVAASLSQHGEALGERFASLRREQRASLQEIASTLDKQLVSSFEKTTSTFSDVMRRLTVIDEAQKKITELSCNVVSLQEILTDKRSRGAFGEVQLEALIRNMLPDNNFCLQYTFSTGKRVDCLLELPEPTGKIAVDAKFPLENFRLMVEANAASSERKTAQRNFKQDLKKHINDIASKYIIPGETGDGAVLFIPAEAIFAEIHANYPDIVEYAQRARVWLASPTTMMAILTTARAVLKDAATRKQVHIIQNHLTALAKDFTRFEQRMDNLARHIDQTQQDVTQIHTSSKKISKRFSQIEAVELEETNAIPHVENEQQTT